MEVAKPTAMAAKARGAMEVAKAVDREDLLTAKDGEQLSFSKALIKPYASKIAGIVNY